MICASRPLLCGIVIAAAPLFAQSMQEIRLIPPAGVEVPERVRPGLEEGLARLEDTIAKLGDNKLLPDVLIYHQAVRYALQYNEFFNEGQFADARRMLQTGQRRAELFFAQIASIKAGSPQ